MNKRFHPLGFVWLWVASIHARHRISNVEHAKQFLGDGWEAYVQQFEDDPSAARGGPYGANTFGQTWKPH